MASRDLSGAKGQHTVSSFRNSVSQSSGKISLENLLNHLDSTADAHGVSHAMPCFMPQVSQTAYPPHLPVSFSIPPGSVSAIGYIGRTFDTRPMVERTVHERDEQFPYSRAPGDAIHPSPLTFANTWIHDKPKDNASSTAKQGYQDRSPVAVEACHSHDLRRIYPSANVGSRIQPSKYSDMDYSLPPIDGVRHQGSMGRRNIESGISPSPSPAGSAIGVLAPSGPRHSLLDDVLQGRSVVDHLEVRQGTHCRKCGKTFKTKQGAHRHNQTVHLKLRPFQCVDCQNRFGQKCSLQRHQRSVHKRKDIRFGCEHLGCGKLYEDYRHLQQHIKIVHNGAPPFKCHVGHCTSTFMWASSHANHLANCHGIGKETMSAE